MNTTFDEAEQCRFETDGFVVRRDVFDVAEVQQIRDTCERLVGEMVERRNGRRAKAGSYVFEPIADINVLIKWEGHPCTTRWAGTAPGSAHRT